MSRLPDQDPVESAGGLGEDSKKFDHPAFGQIGASRVQGTRTLYGSDFLHRHFVTITISRSQLCRDLSHDWHFGGRDLIEVHLSEAQWATFVSSMNVGGGVPCTIDHVLGEDAPGIPLRRNVDVVENELQKTVADIRKAVDDVAAQMESDIGQSLSGAKRSKLLAGVARLRRLVDDHIPFMAKSFRKTMENTVEKAKIEVNAYAESVIVRSGIAALRGGTAEPPIQISDGKPGPRPCPCGDMTINDCAGECGRPGSDRR